jgi:hypothetical protein
MLISIPSLARVMLVMFSYIIWYPKDVPIQKIKNCRREERGEGGRVRGEKGNITFLFNIY